MNNIQKLEKILKTDVMIELNEEIKALNKLVLKEKNNEDLKLELDYMLDVKKYYDEVILHIEKNILEEKDATNILADLEDMRADDEDEV